MSEYGTPTHRFADPAVREIEEGDIPAVIELFRLNYGDDYPIPEFYDQRWVKRGIYSDHIIWLVIEEEAQIVASGAVILDYGDYNDQIGEIGRLVVHPQAKGRGLGRRIVTALLDATDDTVEFAFGEARTVHPLSQALFEGAGFTAVGFMPQGYLVGEQRESFVLYAMLYGNGAALRSPTTPRVIHSVAPLARHTLAGMGLPTELEISDPPVAYPAERLWPVMPMERRALPHLLRVEHGRLVEPLIFGGISLDQGFSLLRRRQAVYLMAMDEGEQAVGAVGYQVDAPSRIVKGIQLVAEEGPLRGSLCATLIQAATDYGAEIIEVNVSAYDPLLQQSFAAQGFVPVAYLPAMVFHGMYRLDVVKMLRLNFPFDPGEMALTEHGREMAELVAANFGGAI